MSESEAVELNLLLDKVLSNKNETQHKNIKLALIITTVSPTNISEATTNTTHEYDLGNNTQTPAESSTEINTEATNGTRSTLAPGNDETSLMTAANEVTKMETQQTSVRPEINETTKNETLRTTNQPKSKGLPTEVEDY